MSINHGIKTMLLTLSLLAILFCLMRWFSPIRCSGSVRLLLKLASHWSSCATFLQLIKTHNLLPSRNYIFGYHPHGVLCFGAFCNFGTEATGFSKKFPGIKPSLATLAGNFRMPVLRDYLMSGGEMLWEAMRSGNNDNCIYKGADLCPFADTASVYLDVLISLAVLFYKAVCP